MTHTRIAVAQFNLVLLAMVCSQIQAADWPRFRGPNGTGVSVDERAVPATWSPATNIAWSQELPGAGVSSPIVANGRVFVTSYSGYGVDRENPGEMEQLKRHLTCFTADTGKRLWSRQVDAVLPEDPYEGIGVPAHGYASHTPVTDGNRIFAFFGKTGVVAFDWDGNELWRQSVGTESDPWQWGSASSPILHQNLLIVTASAESQALVALDTESGEEVWRTEATQFDGLWGTPALVDIGETSELVVAVPGEIWAFDVNTGKLRWFTPTGQSDQSHASVVVDGRTVYAVGGRGSGSTAVSAGGSGDVSQDRVLWSGRDSTGFGTPVLANQKLYVAVNGTLLSVDADSGRRDGQTRLSGSGEDQEGDGGRGGRGRGRGGFGGPRDYPSPVVADGKLYYLRSNGSTHVYRLGDELEPLGVNRLTDEDESFGGTPAISDGRIYIRSNRKLYCIADED